MRISLYVRVLKTQVNLAERMQLTPVARRHVNLPGFFFVCVSLFMCVRAAYGSS